MRRFGPESCLWEFICRKVPHSCPDMSLPGEFTNGVEERQLSEARAGVLAAWAAAGEEGSQD